MQYIVHIATYSAQLIYKTTDILYLVHVEIEIVFIYQFLTFP